MILIWGAVYDNPLKEVFAELQSRDIPVLLIDQKYIQRSKIELDISSPVSCTINYLNQVFHSEDVRSVYIRTYDFTQEDEWTSDKLYDEAHRHAYRFEEYMSIWLEHSTLKVVNKLSNLISNSSKPFQMDIIRKHGFKVPETIITTDPEFAKEFLAKHKKIIYKSISSFRSIVSCLTKNDISRLNDVIFCPTQFQKNIDGTDYRVHVLGEKIFPVKITSTASDFRYSSETKITASRIPDEIAEKCLKITRSMGLHFSGIDLRRTSDDEWYCFEVNPSPGYTYFSNMAGQNITSELVDYLLN